MSFDWKETLATVAPTIATALGGPLAGVAVNMVASKLGIEPTQEAVQSAIASGDPSVMLQLKQVESEFKVKMRELDIKEMEVHAQNTDSARKLYAVNKWPQITLSALFITGYFAVLIYLFSGKVQLDDDTRAILTLLLGLITREVPTIMQFWFGSSVGSKEKGEELKINK
jgi:ABC-type branched-subunit amino acid transport system permease subunit